ncbi:Uma2 family endonuclease [Trichormus variabilis]|uniref:Putative restriction endonuclease domain-containing protein n=1 Tax=Trichormus variabilis SAG 1403-4b TaxID=447716 RepID=A0A3S1CRF3_ANAVA|nr:Uma2 family endonuclease [Trichormus variabilis]MBD2627721.1 Uma2 family endonuclease [Trichormus variabilis FACHB-164]RUS97088.1 hypothetical protein DSM107003_18290 [Trichormus variabilis SAG 1403-4b]
MSEIKPQLPTDTWIVGTWDQYMQTIDNRVDEKAKTYYHNGQMRVEMPPVGNDHASDQTIIISAIGIFVATKGIDMNGKDNCTYQKIGLDAQPDVSYYIGENANIIPYGTSIINLDIYPPPNLVIEVAHNSLADDKGEKRLIYEDLGVAEYWIVDVQNVQIIAFAMENGGSRRITQSQVLSGLSITLLNEALQRTRLMNHGQVCAWLLTEFQQ